MQKNTPHNKAQGMNENLSNSHSTDTGTLSQAQIERDLKPSQSHALRLTRLPNGANNYEALHDGHLSFIARVMDLRDKGFVFAETIETVIDMFGIEHKGVKRFKYLYWVNPNSFNAFKNDIQPHTADLTA